MLKAIFKVLVVTTALTSATVAMSQDAPATTQAANAPATQGATLDVGGAADIVVTARRESESLQSVPVSIQVVTGDSIQTLAITQASELSKLTPGLTLNGGASSTDTKVVLRGVTWTPGSGTPATPIYFNEIPFDPISTLQTVFDVGQIEVLRGPQGTTRGAPSISGAVTISTRRPDLDEFGGYVQGQYGSGDHVNGQGAVNIPILRGVFAIRAAANYEESNGSRVRSVNSSIDPFLRSRTYRVTALLKPTDTLSLTAMYQRRETDRRDFTQVAGTGSPGSAAARIPANFNGPALTVGDRLAVQDGPNILPDDTDLITVNASWEVFGHTLSYNYGRQLNRSGLGLLQEDFGNSVPGYEAYASTEQLTKPFFQTHEVRLSSIRDDSRPFDYDIGWFQKRSDGNIRFQLPVFLAGAFGAPGTLPGAVTTPANRYLLQTATNIGIGQSFNSFYGNVRFYLSENTELSGGLSILRDRAPVALSVSTSAAAIVATPLAALGGLPCAGIPGVFVTGLVNGTYPGFCDAAIPAGSGNSTESYNNSYSDALYNFSLSHKFSPDLLVYATTGTSFRTGLPAIATTGLPTALLVPQPETATSYEVGVKSSFGRRLRVNAAVFQINYQNQLTQFSNVPYFNSVSGTTSLTTGAFFRNVDARVRGAELEIATKPTDNLSLNANISYSKITSRGGLVPDGSGTGPALTAANPINFVQSEKGQTLNTQAPFQATVNGSYDVPIGPVNGYFRFNVNYQGRNPNFQNFSVNGEFRKAPAYAIVDLFLGVTGNKGGWDLGLYAKNVFDNNVELTRFTLANNIYAPFAGANVGYNGVTSTVPRELGVSLRYAFGSR